MATATGRQRPLLWVPPRFGTPRDPSRETLGPQVAEVARRLGKEPMPHQAHVWDVVHEVDEDGRHAYDAAVVTIMRQSGKTTQVLGEKTWRLAVAPKLRRPDGKLWGRQRALYTAQRRQDARKKLEQDFAFQLRDAKASFTEITNPRGRPVRANEWKLSLNNGGEHILIGQGNYLLIDAPTDDAGHSDTLDLVVTDEAFALADDDVEQGVIPTMATRWNAQHWTVSTAGDEKSFYLWSKVRAGRKHACTCGAQTLDRCRCGYEPSRARIAYFEWSLPDDADIDDERLWWQHMPALGRTISPEFVRAQLEKARQRTEEGGEDLWRRGYANQWVKIPMLGGETRQAKLPVDDWAAARIPYAEEPARNPGEVVFAFDIAPGGTSSSIVAAVGSQAHPYVELVAHAEGTGWLPRRLAELARTWRPPAIGFDQAGPAGALADVIRDYLADEGLPAKKMMRPMTSQEYRAACGGFHLAVVEGRLSRSESDLPLDASGADATDRRVGDAWVWDRRSAQVPICPLVAATVAMGLLSKDSKKREPMFAFTK